MDVCGRARDAAGPTTTRHSWKHATQPRERAVRRCTLSHTTPPFTTRARGGSCTLCGCTYSLEPPKTHTADSPLQRHAERCGALRRRRSRQHTAFQASNHSCKGVIRQTHAQHTAQRHPKYCRTAAHNSAGWTHSPFPVESPSSTRMGYIPLNSWLVAFVGRFSPAVVRVKAGHPTRDGRQSSEWLCASSRRPAVVHAFKQSLGRVLSCRQRIDGALFFVIFVGFCSAEASEGRPGGASRSRQNVICVGRVCALWSLCSHQTSVRCVTTCVHIDHRCRIRPRIFLCFFVFFVCVLLEKKFALSFVHSVCVFSSAGEALLARSTSSGGSLHPLHLLEAPSEPVRPVVFVACPQIAAAHCKTHTHAHTLTHAHTPQGSATSKLLRAADAVAVLYSLVDGASFDAAASVWLPLVASKTAAGVPIVFVGTKLDLTSRDADAAPGVPATLDAVRAKVPADLAGRVQHAFALSAAEGPGCTAVLDYLSSATSPRAHSCCTIS